MKSKKIREKGKISFRRYFQKFKQGDNVSLVRELAVGANFPRRLQGKTGVIQEKRGRSYFVKIKDSNKTKMILVEPIHLKKIKQVNE
jgi:ribosomal protein L21E|tara:strand:- start:224 stop:484 length:261 start_codon:yes stop_codon:yes gene_type:complete